MESVHLNGYSVRVQPAQGSCQLTSKNQVIMPGDGVTYSIILDNNTVSRCSAQVYIDGSSVGNFLLGPLETACIERPVQVDKKFTFFVGGSYGSHQSGFSRGKSTNGLIEVRFIPEAKPRQFFLENATIQSNLRCKGETRSFSADTVEGVTGLTGHSRQRYTATTTPDLDHSRKTSILLRLVAPLSSTSIQPLPGKRSTPYPPTASSSMYM